MPVWAGYVIAKLRTNFLIMLRWKLKFRDEKRLVSLLWPSDWARTCLSVSFQLHQLFDLLQEESLLLLGPHCDMCTFPWTEPFLGPLLWGSLQPRLSVGKPRGKAILALGHPLSAGDYTSQLPLLLVAFSCSWTSPSWVPLPTLSQSQLPSVQFSSAPQSCPTLCDPMDCSMPGFPVHHQLLELTHICVHWVSDAIQLSYPLSSPSPPDFNLSQNQGLFYWVSYSNQVVKVLEFQHQSF